MTIQVKKHTPKLSLSYHKKVNFFTIFFGVDFTGQTALSNVKTYPMCTIGTSDPSININLSFQVEHIFLSHTYLSNNFGKLVFAPFSHYF
jgi:hypothetical protein